MSAEFVFVDDGISGAEFTNRPGFLRLMNALKPRPPTTCDGCGRPFTPVRPHQRCCRPSCRTLAFTRRLEAWRGALR